MTSVDGKVFWVGKPASSSSPSSGDSRLIGQAIKEELEDEAKCLQMETGLVKLLRGTDSYFLALFVDLGFVFVPENVDDEGIGKFDLVLFIISATCHQCHDISVSLQDFMEECGGILVAPAGEETEKILQTGLCSM